MKYHIFTFLFLLLAVVSYALGAVVGVPLFIALGVITESIFWVRLFRLSHGH
jgi:hypothetical protein